MYRIVPALLWHAEELAANMRPADAAEVWASGHFSPLAAVTRSLQVSRDPLTALEPGGRVMCVFGVSTATALSAEGAPWMLGTEHVARHARVFLEGSKVWTRQISKEYASLQNHVDARNKSAVRWLRWLGFTIYDAEPWGAEGLPFHRFRMESKGR